MKIVVNRCWGGFGLSDWAMEQLGINVYYDIDRTDSRLIELVENFPTKVDNRSSALEVVTIPDESTDWELNDYDGMESVIYVVDGKIRRT